MEDEKEHEVHYLRSDGNGGYSVSKSIIGLASFLLLILGMVIPFALAYGTMSEKIAVIEGFIEVQGPRHVETIKVIESRIDSNEMNNAIISEQISQINRDIGDIKKGIEKINDRYEVKD